MLPRIRVQRITTRIQIVYNRIGDVMVSVLASSDVMVSVLASSADLIVIIIILIKLTSSRHDLAEKLLSWR
jgi:hypothetical protein